MRAHLSFAGRIRPLPYVLWSTAVFFSQHLIAYVVFEVYRRPLPLDWGFLVTPLGSVVKLDRASDPLLLLAFGVLLGVAWMLAALAFRRAVDANLSQWIAVFAIVPVAQLLVIPLLGLVPSRRAAEEPVLDRWSDPEGSAWAGIVQGMIAGMALTLFAVATSALVFRVYGFGMFLASPVVIGATTGYFVNRYGDIGGCRTAASVLAALLLGAIALVVAALEGLGCILLAAPLFLGAALLGASLGRSIASYATRPVRPKLSGVGVPPWLFALEAMT